AVGVVVLELHTRDRARGVVAEVLGRDRARGDRRHTRPNVSHIASECVAVGARKQRLGGGVLGDLTDGVGPRREVERVGAVVRRCGRVLDFFFVIVRPQRSTLFPYTTLFRSAVGVVVLELHTRDRARGVVAEVLGRDRAR